MSEGAESRPGRRGWSWPRPNHSPVLPSSLQPLFPGANELDQISKIHDVIGTPAEKTLAKFRQYVPCAPESRVPSPGSRVPGWWQEGAAGGWAVPLLPLWLLSPLESPPPLTGLQVRWGTPRGPVGATVPQHHGKALMSCRGPAVRFRHGPQRRPGGQLPRTGRALRALTRPSTPGVWSCPR